MPGDFKNPSEKASVWQKLLDILKAIKMRNIWEKKVGKS